MSDSKPLVLQILPTLSLGGAERFAIELATHLPSYGFDTRIISLFDSGPLLDEVRKRGIAYEQLLESHGGSRVELVKKLASVIYGGKSSLVRSVRSVRSVRLGREEVRTNEPTNQRTERSPAIVHTHLFGSDFWTAVVKTIRSPISDLRSPIFISTAHSVDRDDGFARRLARGWAAKRFDRCVGISKTVEDYLAKDLGVRHDRIIGIDGMRFVSGDTRGEVPFHDPPRFVSVGRLVSLKGLDTTLRALAAIQDPWQYTIVGSGPVLREWRELSERLGITSRVHFISATSDIASILQSSDCFLFPSHWEGLGSAAIDAASVGLPVLASDLPSLQSVFPKSQRVRIGDTNAWTNAIRELLAHPEEILTSARKRAPAISTRFDPETVTKKYAELYQGILKNKA